MPAFSDKQYSPYSPKQIYALVADVASYPDFLPWCRAARITNEKEFSFHGELVLNFKHITEQYTSLVELYPGSSEQAEHRIDVGLVKGPFKNLSNKWTFLPASDGGTDIRIDVDFNFRSKVLDKLIGAVFTLATEKMISAFITRADELYGKNT